MIVTELAALLPFLIGLPKKEFPFERTRIMNLRTRKFSDVRNLTWRILTLRFFSYISARWTCFFISIVTSPHRSKRNWTGMNQTCKGSLIALGALIQKQG